MILRDCIHGASPSGPGEDHEPLHKLKVLAETFGVTDMAIVRRLSVEETRENELPYFRVRGRWVFVSDSNLREWYRRGIVIGRSVEAVTPEGDLQLACGHVVTGIPSTSVRHVVGCRHDLKPALHKVRIIAKTYAVTEANVQARIRTKNLPTTRVGTGAGRGGVPLFVSDENLREWIRQGVSIGNGTASMDHEARMLQLACGWFVNEIPDEKPRPRFVRRLVKCRHGDAHGAAHSFSAIAASVGKTPTEIFGRIPYVNRVMVGGVFDAATGQVTDGKAYATDEVIREFLGVAAGVKLACGWVIA